MKHLNDQPLFLDVRQLALQKFFRAKGKADFLTYREARLVLGRSLHLSKLQSRSLLLQMVCDGLITWDCRGRIWIIEEDHHGK